jgi:hypothetical protein
VDGFELRHNGDFTHIPFFGESLSNLQVPNVRICLGSGFEEKEKQVLSSFTNPFELKTD